MEKPFMRRDCEHVELFTSAKAVLLECAVWSECFSVEMDRDAKLAAARKKLKQFKRRKEQRPLAQNPITEADISQSSLSDRTPESLNEETILETQKSEEFIDEKFEVLTCTDGNGLSESTAATTESILQVSAKLDLIATEGDMFIDDASVQSSEEKFQIVEHPRTPEQEAQNEMVKNLELRNVELAFKLSSITQENEELNSRCGHLSEEVDSLQAQRSESQRSQDRRNHEENDLREQLQVQMQTIGVLVSEKQDLQQELLTVRSELHSSNLQQNILYNDVQSLKDKVILHERDLQSKSNVLESLENDKLQLGVDYNTCKQEVEKLKQALEKEESRSLEIDARLHSREAEYRELNASHSDAQEKLEMADVLLQQLSTSNNSDAVSRLTQLQEENGALNARLNDYQQAFEQLTTEREHLNRQYKDAQKEWEDHLRMLREKVQSLEMEKQALFEDYNHLQTLLERKHEEPSQEQTALELDSHENEEPNSKEQLEEALHNLEFLREEAIAQQRNNQDLSLLIQEKESRIIELEMELNEAKTAMQEHEQLLDEARSDKVTISRALTQNKQLKQQFGEIQEGFIRMSNDKMDLATKVSSLEHVNKDLLSRLSESSAAHHDATQELENSKTELQRLQLHLANIQRSGSDDQSSAQPSGDSEVIEALNRKLESTEERLKQLASENFQLRNEKNNISQAVFSNLTSDVQETSLTQQPHVSGEVSPSRVLVHDKEILISLVPDAHEEESMISPVAPVHEEESVISPVADAPAHEESVISPVAPAHKEEGVISPVADAAAHEEESVISPVAHAPAHEEEGVISHDAEKLLQEKFTMVMKEKAELMNRVELLEHTNTQLQNECDTIGEYIALYHNQRQVLRRRHREKDEYMSTIVREREAMQGKIEQLQTLIVAMLNRPQSVNAEYYQSWSQNDDSQDLTNGGQQQDNVRTNLQQTQPDLVPETDNLISEESGKFPGNTLPGRSKKVYASSESSNPECEDATASQILNLLEQIQRPVDPKVCQKALTPSGFCMNYIGPYTAI